MPHDLIRDLLTDINNENIMRESSSRFMAGYQDGYTGLPAVSPHVDSFGYQSYFEGWWAGYADAHQDGRID